MKKATCSDKGEAGELLVAADLLTRGQEVTKPFNRNGPDDLHVRASGRWWNVQVKVAAKISKGRPTLEGVRRGGQVITSEILAIVHLKKKRVRYISNTSLPLPEELQ